MTDITTTFCRTTLSSGLTVLSERMPERRSISIGTFVRTGARDEPAEDLGISHFLEHMMFKGTEGRDARAIARSLESLGGHLDAFTGREHVCYYARVLGEHLPHAIDVMADIVCRSRLAPEDVEREKSVVREEIFAYDDNPEEKVLDQLAEQLWGDHGLGRPILGTAETVAALTPDRLRATFARRYRADQLVVAATGGLEHDRLVDLVQQHFSPPGGAEAPLSSAPGGFAPRVIHNPLDVQQLYVTLAARTVPDLHPDRYKLVVLNAILGGGMSSRLFQSVREEAGLAYSVYSSIDFYRDAGAIVIQMGVSPERAREALQRVRLELDRMRREGPSEAEVDDAKNQLVGNLLLDHESVSARMFHLGGEEVTRRTFTPTDEVVERVRLVTHAQVCEIASLYLDPAGFTLVALGPTEGKPLDSNDWPAAS
jgi:predicted Zn-dependent peptidase